MAFFTTAQDAERAGYRECRRCRPGSVAGPAIDICVNAARAYLDAHLDETITLRTLAGQVGMSPCHLQRTFKAHIGLSPKAYVSARRFERFKKIARSGSSVTEAMYEAGFGGPRALYERAGEALGMTPAAYRRGGEGIEIRYTVIPCSFGFILVGRTHLGVCAVLLGDSEDELETELRQEFPKGVWTRDDGGREPWVATVIASVDGTQRRATAPLDMRGTDFQRRVWAMLQRIPRGETRSYGQIAAALGNPTASRAVAQACAANKLAVLIPCHRVVRSDGETGGYRWGATRKRELLARERRSESDPAEEEAAAKPSKPKKPR